MPIIYIHIYSIIVVYIYMYTLFTPRIRIQSETTKLEKRVPTLNASGRGWIVYLNRPFRVSWNQMILGQRWTRRVVHEANECLKKIHKLFHSNFETKIFFGQTWKCIFSPRQKQKQQSPGYSFDPWQVSGGSTKTDYSTRYLGVFTSRNPDKSSHFHDPGRRRPARWSKKWFVG